MRRAAEYGDAWYPVFTLNEFSASAAPQSIPTDEELARRFQQLRDHCEAIGRDPPPELQVIEPPGGRGEGRVSLLVDRIGRLHGLGASGVTIHIEATEPAEWRDKVERYRDVFDQVPAAHAGG